MHQLRVQSALGRGRPTACPIRVDAIAFPLRQFHISAIRSKEDETQAPQNSRKQRNQSITRLTRSLSEQAAPPSLIRRVNHDGASAVDARNLAASPPTSNIRSFKPEQQKYLRESPTRQPQRPPPKRRDPPQARPQGPTKRQPRTPDDDDDSKPMSFGSDSSEEFKQLEQDLKEAMADSAKGAKDQGKLNLDGNLTLAEVEKRLSKHIDELEQLEEAGEPKEYEPPTEISLGSLAGYGPAISMGEFGMSEVVGDRVRGALGKLEGERERREALSKIWVEGKNYRYRSKDEREAVEHLVQKAQPGLRDQQDEDDNGDLLTPEQGNQLVEQLFPGSYTVGGKEGGVFGELRRKLGVNESYLPEDGEKVVKKVRALMPGQGGGKGKGKAVE